MEWIDFLKFVLIEDIKNLIFYLRIKQKDVYLINNASFNKIKIIDETLWESTEFKKESFI